MARKTADGSASSNDLVPLFIPPLVTMLASAEKSKGSHLNEEEVLSTRDKAACIMMAPEDAQRMAESRGFRDVDPENCWADWHRLRVEFTGAGFLPKLVLCVLCGPDAESQFGGLFELEGVDHEWGERDERMPSAFQTAECRCDPSLASDDLESIGSHSRVLYVLSSNFTASDGPGVCLTFLKLGRRLLEAGALAIKCESSGVAHGRARWLELADEAEGVDVWSALFRSFVQLPVKNKDDLFTCGMHLLGQPDLIVSSSLLSEAFGSTGDQAWNAVDLFRGFSSYLLSECVPGRFSSGHSFSLTSTSPRFRVLWEECSGYEEDDFFFNPFGRWRFAEQLK